MALRPSLARMRQEFSPLSLFFTSIPMRPGKSTTSSAVLPSLVSGGVGNPTGVSYRDAIIKSLFHKVTLLRWVLAALPSLVNGRWKNASSLLLKHGS